MTSPEMEARDHDVLLMEKSSYSNIMVRGGAHEPA